MISQLLLFVAMYLTVCMSYLVVMICYESERPLIALAVSVFMSLAFSITVSTLIWRLQ